MTGHDYVAKNTVLLLLAMYSYRPPPSFFIYLSVVLGNIPSSIQFISYSGSGCKEEAINHEVDNVFRMPPGLEGHCTGIAANRVPDRHPLPLQGIENHNARA